MLCLPSARNTDFLNKISNTMVKKNPRMTIIGLLEECRKQARCDQRWWLQTDLLCFSLTSWYHLIFSIFSFFDGLDLLSKIDSIFSLNLYSSVLYEKCSALPVARSSMYINYKNATTKPATEVFLSIPPACNFLRIFSGQLKTCYFLLCFLLD